MNLFTSRKMPKKSVGISFPKYSRSWVTVKMFAKCGATADSSSKR